MAFFLGLIIFSGTLPLLAVNIHDTRLLTDPAISRNKIAFAYANDLWIADLDGSNVKRLTSHPGIEFRPCFSPDGKQIAFSGQYDGNTDVFVVAAEGGVPVRLTRHPGVDLALGFTPDGSSVLFASPRETYTRRFQQLYTVPATGGSAERLPIPTAFKATYSPDGKHMVYLPLTEPFLQWKHYRGGEASRLLVYDTGNHAVVQIPQVEGRCNDTDPVWMGKRIYFRSDRNGEFNIYSYEPGSEAVEQLTFHEDFPVLGLSGSTGRILYEQAGHLHILDPEKKQASRLRIGVAADLLETRPRFAKGAKYIRNASLSPSGARAAFEFRGEIITVPQEEGDDRNLTSSFNANDRSPAWSPDGKSIAYFSDSSGEYRLYVSSQDGRGIQREFKLTGAGFYEDAVWSPDSKRIAYTDNSWSLYVLDLESGQSTKVAAHPLYAPDRPRKLEHSWSPDSRWLAYVRSTKTYINQILLYSIEAKESYPVTDAFSHVSEPVFDRNGKYLYFFASTDAGPVQDWFSMSNADMLATQAIYVATLKKGVASPIAKQSDEEEGKKEEPEKKKNEKEKEDTVKVEVDFDSLLNRIQAMPIPSGFYVNLKAGKAGQIFYRKYPAGGTRFNEKAQATLQRYDLEKRKEDTYLDQVDWYQISDDGKQLLLQNKEEWFIAELAEKMDSSKQKKLAIDRIQVKIDPLIEWRQIFDEAWRINRDYFYDPNFHGADWKAMKEKYAVFLPDVTVRQDLNRVMQWMSSELAVGHHRLGGGDSLADTETRPGGLLGADYKVENGRYRFAKVYGGLNWNPELRSPLTEPGVDVKAGEYLLAVEGKELRYPEDVYSRFEQTAGRIVEITVGPNPEMKASRTVKVVPVEEEIALRNRDWVETNIRKVHEATGGRVAYVYVPNTTGLGHTYFKRYFFPQADKEAILIDERHNGGGQVADYYIDILRRPLISYWATRYGEDIKTPLASIQGPKVMLIDETAGSGGDLLPWMFRKLEMGTLIGRRTWGGLVGILGYPDLMDGGWITAPNLAFWTEQGFEVENEGVPPDIEVEQTPADVIAGHDPQLEKAIEVVMKQLQDSPVQKWKRPAYPIRVKKPRLGTSLPVTTQTPPTQ